MCLNSLSAVLIRPASPLLVDIVLLVEGRVVACKALVRCLIASVAWFNCCGGDVADPVQELGGEFLAIVTVSGRNYRFRSSPQSGSTGVEDFFGRDVATVVAEGWVVDGGIPVAGLPASNAKTEQVGEIIIVGQAINVEDILQVRDHLGIVLAE